MAVSFLSSDRHLCRFLQACGNSWHGALYITCGECPRAISRRCRDLLCVFDANAQPIFIPVQDAELLWHTDIGEDDCLTVWLHFLLLPLLIPESCILSVKGAGQVTGEGVLNTFIAVHPDVAIQHSGHRIFLLIFSCIRCAAPISATCSVARK